MIDEVHTLIGAGAAEGAIDAANILKPALARGELQCIGATTLDEYRKHIEKDAALERCVALDQNGRPASNVLLWSDSLCRFSGRYPFAGLLLHQATVSSIQRMLQASVPQPQPAFFAAFARCCTAALQHVPARTTGPAAMGECPDTLAFTLEQAQEQAQALTILWVCDQAFPASHCARAVCGRDLPDSAGPAGAV